MSLFSILFLLVPDRSNPLLLSLLCIFALHVCPYTVFLGIQFLNMRLIPLSIEICGSTIFKLGLDGQFSADIPCIVVRFPQKGKLSYK